MFRQVLMPNEKNATITIPTELFGMEVLVLAYPVAAKQTKEKKQFTWLNSSSKINNPIYIGKEFRKISRDEINDRKNIY